MGQILNFRHLPQKQKNFRRHRQVRHLAAKLFFRQNAGIFSSKSSLTSTRRHNKPFVEVSACHTDERQRYPIPVS